MKHRVLIADDDPGMRRLLANLLVREYAVREARSGEEALLLAAAWHPDLVFLDLVMLGIDGHETCRQLKALPAPLPPQVIVVSASSLADDMRLAFAAGADDYFVKPIGSRELLSRAQLHMQLRTGLQAGSGASDAGPRLSKEEKTADSDGTHAIQNIAVFAITKLAETRDSETAAHLNRMREYSTRLAEEVRRTTDYRRFITDGFLEDLYHSSPLHDFGKAGVPDKVLLKPGRLTAYEYDVVKQHTVIGAEILAQTARLSTVDTFLGMAAQIARSHHERWDGSGYPEGLTGEAIPLAARIVAVADVFEALTSQRQYEPAWGTERACGYILERADSHFDPVIAKCFGSCFEDIERIYRQFPPVDVDEMTPRSPRLTVVATSQ